MVNFDKEYDRRQEEVNGLEATLKPCPFCGGRAKLSTYVGGNYGGYTLVEIFCSNTGCGIELKGENSTRDTFDESMPKYRRLAERWNTRKGE